MKIGIIGAGMIGATLARRLTALGHETARRNGRGNWDCRAVCHGGKGGTGLFFDPSQNFVWCNAGCELSVIAAAPKCYPVRRPENPA